MPMLDLLIHVTAANKIAPSSHVLQVCDENRRLLAHMPSTPIGNYSSFFIFSNSPIQYSLALALIYASEFAV